MKAIYEQISNCDVLDSFDGILSDTDSKVDFSSHHKKICMFARCNVLEALQSVLKEQRLQCL